MLKYISDELFPLFAQVKFRDKPLSYYLLNMEAEGNTPQTRPEDDVRHCRAGPTQEALTTGLLFLSAEMHNLSSSNILPLTFLSGLSLCQ